MSGIFILAPTPALRAGLRALLTQADPSWQIVGEASALEAGSDDPAEVNAGLFLLTDPNQLAPLAGVVADDRSQSAVVLTNDASAINALRALPLRGWSIAPPDASAEELHAAVLAAMQGFIALPEHTSRPMFDLRSNPEAATRSEGAELEQPLTPREIEVLELVSRGLPSKLIARELDVTESTIKFHLSSIYAKLNVASRTEAVSRAARLGLIVL